MIAYFLVLSNFVNKKQIKNKTASNTSPNKVKYVVPIDLKIFEYPEVSGASDCYYSSLAY